MKVKELIEKLQEFDPETVVVVYDGLDFGYKPAGGVGEYFLYKETKHDAPRLSTKEPSKGLISRALLLTPSND